MNPLEAKKLLFDTINVFNKVGIKYYLDYGTLLGAYRNGNFIPNDHDIDIGIYEKFWLNPILMRNIAKEFIKREITIRKIWDNGVNGIVNLTRNDAGLDIYHKVRGKTEYYKYGKRGKRTYPLDCLDKLNTMEFLGKKVNIPSNTEKYLINLYGENWRIPMSKSQYGHTKNVIPIKWKHSSPLSIKIPYIIAVYVKDEFIEMATKEEDYWKEIWERKGNSNTDNLKELDGYENTNINPQEVAKSITEILDIKENDKVLEVGCGAGMITQYIKCNYTGIDYSYNLVKKHKTILNNKVFVSEAQLLPFKDNSFDKCFAYSVFHYFPNYKYANKVINEMKRVCKGDIFIGDLPRLSPRKEHLLFGVDDFKGEISEGFYNKERFNILLKGEKNE